MIWRAEILPASSARHWGVKERLTGSNICRSTVVSITHKLRLMLVDLRSDTVTYPTTAMLSTMTEASVGDDGRTNSHGRSEDPTVRRLEDRAAELLGMPSGLFVPSGTFGNMLGALAQSDVASPMWVYEHSHILDSERALFDTGLFARPYKTYVDFGDVPSTPPENGPLLLVENTVSSDAGRPLDADELHRLDELHRAGWSIHMDGARLFNAVIKTGRSAAETVASCDTVTFCLSKGLGAPIGSILCGDADVIDRARVLRKRLGGAMRQAGYVAAAGLIALDAANIERLADDHRKANVLREAMGVIDDSTVLNETNIIAIRFEHPIAALVTDLLGQRGYLVRTSSKNELRVVTHRDITFEQAHQAGIAITDCTDAAVKQIGNELK